MSEEPEKRVLRITLEIECRLEDDGGDFGDDPEDLPSFDEYTPTELARLCSNALQFPETQDEMFAGTGVFVRFDAVSVSRADWVEEKK